MQQFTPRAQQVLALARKEAQNFRHNYIGTEHILLGIIKLGQGVAVNVLRKMGVNLENASAEIERIVGKGAGAENAADIQQTQRVKKVLAFASYEASQLHHNYIGTEHILLGLLREGEGVAATVLRELGIDINGCRNQILAELDPNFVGDFPEQQPQEQGAPQERAEGRQASALKAFGRDLTELARADKLDPVVGRANEIMRVVQILCRRTKTTPSSWARRASARPPS